MVKPSEYRSRPIAGSNFEPPVTSNRIFAAHDVVHLAEHQRPDVHADAAQPEIEREQRLEHHARQQPGLLHLLHDALVNQVEELRHAREDRDLALSDSALTRSVELSVSR